MGRHFNFNGFLDVLVLHLVIASTILKASYGFISVDCGSNRESYNDSVTTLTWENDKPYTITGRNAELNISPQDYELARYPNVKAMQTFRYFPEQHNKHCYTLPTPDKTIFVLIRAMFYPGNFMSTLTDQLKLPINFEVAVNATIWFSVRYDDDPYFLLPSHPLVFEGIFYSWGGTINVCLIPIVGIPFISSLELRPLAEGDVMYSLRTNYRKYLVSKSRINFGNETSIVRFPHDNFDRFWDGLYGVVYGPSCYLGQNVSFVSSGEEGSSAPRGMSSAELNYVPSRVMQDAIQFYPDNGSDYSLYVAFSGYWSHPNSSMEENPLLNSAYVILYFRDLQSISSSLKALSMNISIPYIEQSNFSVSNNVTMQAFDNLILESTALSFFLTTPMDPTALPFINAMEIYAEEFFDPTATFAPDEYGIKLLQQIFKLNEVGDPCTPVPFDWLLCTDYGQGLQATSVMLPNIGPVHDGHLGTLSSDSLQLNSSYFPLLPRLQNLTVTHANVGDELLNFIILVLVGSYLPPTIVDFSHNNIRTFPTADVLRLSQPYEIYMDKFDLSHNVLTKTIPSFTMDFNSKDSFYIKYLDLSYNKLSYLPSSWKNATTLGLEVVNFSNNVITDNISLLDELIQGNNATLRNLDVSHNHLYGHFPSSVYFSNLDKLEVAKFDGNQIDGALNLTTWYKSLEEAEQLIKTNITHSNLTSTLQQPALFSFINNSISDITPNAEMIYSTLDFLSTNMNSTSFRKSGLLLHGNPYCNKANSYGQRYLCRQSLTETIPESKKDSLMAKIFGSLGGAAVFFICCALVAAIMKLKKKVFGLQKIHQALADQKVIPLFYSLSDIKAATRKFHSDNSLGRGAFGVVYKGILPDRSSFAVKKLFKAEADQVQILNDFLNEVILISGIKHKNLVHLKGCCIENQERILVYEYVENGNVAEALWGSQIHVLLDWEKRLKICIGIAQGLQYLHEHLQPKIIHRDIKPANILLDKDFNPKIADFGLARSFPDDASKAQTTHHGGTWGYVAPDHEITEKVDVYSFGIVVLEIVSGRKIIESDDYPQDERYLRTWAQKLYKEGTLLKLLPPELRENWPELEFEVFRVISVALLCVDLEPDKRPAMSQVVTMLLGSTDAPTPSVDSSSNLYLDSLSDSDLSKTIPTFKTLSSRFSELNPNSKARAADEKYHLQEEWSLLGSRNRSDSNRTNSINITEMSDLSGR